MKITLLGHAAFLIETDGVRIITDPYSSKIGYRPINESADIITLSHDNPNWHSCLDDIRGEPTIVRGLELGNESPEYSGVRFGAVRVYEDEENNGPNTMVWLESEGLRVLHMGDVGHAITDEQLAACGQVDILLALAGGPPTIELEDLKDFITRLNPRIVIPMHFGMPGLKMSLLPVEEFVALFPDEQVEMSSTSTLEVERTSLPERVRLQVLPPAR